MPYEWRMLALRPQPDHLRRRILSPLPNQWKAKNSLTCDARDADPGNEPQWMTAYQAHTCQQAYYAGTAATDDMVLADSPSPFAVATIAARGRRSLIDGVERPPSALLK